MNISSLSSNSLFETSALTALNSKSSVAGSLQSLVSTGGSANANVSLSDPGKLIAQLHQLSQSDPAEFKKITASVAQQLQTAAASATDPEEASLLKQVASNFSNASQSGKFSDLFSQQSGLPATQATSRHHHAHKAGGDGDGDSNQNTLSQIFSNALTQIQTDLGSSATNTATSTTTTTNS